MAGAGPGRLGNSGIWRYGLFSAHRCVIRITCKCDRFILLLADVGNRDLVYPAAGQVKLAIFGRDHVPDDPSA